MDSMSATPDHVTQDLLRKQAAEDSYDKALADSRKWVSDNSAVMVADYDEYLGAFYDDAADILHDILHHKIPMRALADLFHNMRETCVRVEMEKRGYDYTPELRSIR